MNNIYIGTFDQVNWYQVKCNGLPFNHKPSLKVANHSPDGFAWGYNGSGPSQLALAILLNEVSKERALAAYQDFRREEVATWEHEKPFHFTSADVLRWLSLYIEGK